MADPAYGQPEEIDLFLGVEVFVDVLHQGQQKVPPGYPVALEMEFGWVLSGSTDQSISENHINFQAATFHSSVESRSASFGRLRNPRDHSSL